MHLRKMRRAAEEEDEKGQLRRKMRMGSFINRSINQYPNPPNNLQTFQIKSKYQNHPKHYPN
jgi:hypothetical protein